MSFIKNIFSVANVYEDGAKYKQICIFGKKFLFEIRLTKYFFPKYFKMLWAKICKKKFVIVNVTGGLGDYIQTRNFFPLIKQKFEKDGQKVYLCVMIINRYIDFCKKYDSDCVDLFFDLTGVNPPNRRETFVIEKFSYDWYIDFYGHYKDSRMYKLNKAIRAKNIHNTSRNQKLYITENNKEFMKSLVNVDNFKLHFDKIRKVKNLKDSNYVLIVPTAYTSGNMSEEQVLELSKYFVSKNKKVMIFGLDKNRPTIFDKTYQNLSQQEKEYMINGINKFATYDMPDVINRAEFVIAPNTSVYHFALALNKKIICLTPNFQEYIDLNNKDIIYLINDKIKDIDTQSIITAAEKISEV